MQRALVERAQSGDHEAFSILVRTSYPRLYGVANLVLRDRDRAQDAVQDALVLAWRHIRALRDADAWDAWLYRLTLRACHRAARTSRRRDVVELHVEPDRDRIGESDFAGAVSDREVMAEALARLPYDQRVVLVLHFHLDLPLTEAATILDIPVGTAKSRLHRGLAAMRSALDAEPRPRARQRPGATGMTSEPTFDRQLRELMAELAAPGDTAPAIDHVVSVTRSLRPEPRWLVLLKERPMRTSSVLVAGSPPMRTGLVFAIIALLVAIAATVAVGALVLRQPTVPPAYGPAGNGLIAYAADGDIVVTDASGTQTTPITGGPAIDTMPLFSKDGTRIAFIRREPGSTTRQVMVANADGTALLAASPDLIDVQAFDWSPTGERLALLGTTRTGTTPSLFVTGADGSDWTELNRGALDPRDFVAWRPPAGGELVFRAHPASGDPAAALYAITPEAGAIPRPLMEPAMPEPIENPAVVEPELSPDGRFATYWTWGPNEAGEIDAWGRVLDLDTGDERIATTWGGSASPVTPDGRWVVGVGARLEVEPLDGSAPSRTLGPEIEPAGVHVAISPDGTTVLVTESTGVRTLVDFETGAATPLDVSSDDHASWQRVPLP